MAHRQREIEYMDIGELETAYIDHLKARKGGYIMIGVTTPFLLLATVYRLIPIMIFFAVCMSFWIIGTMLIQSDIDKIHERLEEELGDSNE
jgi:hypothetical protein